MKVYFKYATMGSGKSAKACICAYNYQEQGLKTLCVIPEVDTRHQFWEEDGFTMGRIASRIEGLTQEAYVLKNGEMLTDLIDRLPFKHDVIIIDEVQFLSTEQIDNLVQYSLANNEVIICYGLMTTFKTTLFQGSRRLVELNAELEHLKSVGTNGKCTVVNAKFSNGIIQTEGEDVEVGGNGRYRAISLEEYYRLVRERNLTV